MIKKKTCESCKFREFDCYGWNCSKHNKYYDINNMDYVDTTNLKCKYHKRDFSYSLSNGIKKNIKIKDKTYYYKQGKFMLLEQRSGNETLF